jgi:phosphatidylglycerophosphatase GEP4
MDMNTFNVSATLNVFRLITRPTLCLPHATVSTFNQVPVPLNQAFGKYKNVDIRAVVLDKDNCFARPDSSEVHKPYEVGSYFSGCKACYVAQIETPSITLEIIPGQLHLRGEDSPQSISNKPLIIPISNPSQAHFQRLREAYPGRRLLIVSNSAGTSSLDPNGQHSSAVEKATGVAVLPHRTKKPGCGPEIMEYFRSHPETGVTRPEQVAVVGDRLTTDVMMANFMGSYAVWVKDGVVPPEETSVVSRDFPFGFSS